MRVRVLPVPAPATMRSGPFPAVAAAYCCSLRASAYSIVRSSVDPDGSSRSDDSTMRRAMVGSEDVGETAR